MIEIKVPKEITEYKEKFLFGLTVRQFLSLGVALLICVPLCIFGGDILGTDLTGWVVILVSAPFIAFGFFKYNGMPFEQFILMLYRQMWVEPQKRKYVELTVFWFCRKEIIEEEIARLSEDKKQKKKGREYSGSVQNRKFVSNSKECRQASSCEAKKAEKSERKEYSEDCKVGAGYNSL